MRLALLEVICEGADADIAEVIDTRISDFPFNQRRLFEFLSAKRAFFDMKFAVTFLRAQDNPHAVENCQDQHKEKSGGQERKHEAI